MILLDFIITIYGSISFRTVFFYLPISHISVKPQYKSNQKSKVKKPENWLKD